MYAVIVVLALVLVSWFIFSGTPALNTLLNTYVRIRNESETSLLKTGDIIVGTAELKVRFLWSNKTISMTDIIKVKAYSTTNPGLEFQFKHLEVHTRDHLVLSFNAENGRHRDIVTRLLNLRFNRQIDLDTDFPPEGADANGEIF